MKVSLLSTAATATGEWIPIPTDIVGVRSAQLLGFQATAIGSGTVTGTILIEGTINGTYAGTIDTITLNATAPASGFSQVWGKYEAVRAKVTALSASTTIIVDMSV